MLIRLAIVAAALTTAPIPPQAIAVSAHAGSRVNGPSKIDESRAQIPPTLTSNSTQNENDKRDGVKITDVPQLSVSVQRDQFDRSYWVFSGLLVVVGSLQVILLWRTWKKATDDSISAAAATQAILAAIERQAKEMSYQNRNTIKSERPWIVANFTRSQEETIPENGSLRFNWEVKNVGRTPARLTFAAARVVFNIDKEPLPDVPDYGEPDYFFTERVIVPGGTLTFLSHWYERKDGKYRRLYQTENVKTLDLLVGFGRVKYRDTFNSGKEYVTCFCDTSMIGGIDVSEPFSPWMDAPAEYTYCT